MKKIFWTHTIILTIFVLIWELLYFQLDLISMLNIPGTEIRIFGLVTLIMTITINTLSIKKLFKNNITKSILRLTTLGTVTTLIAFSSLQILRIIIDKYNNESIDYYYLFMQTIILTIFSLIFSFLISFEVTTKRTGMTLLMLVLTSIIFAMMKGIIKM
jgi:uncharacterized membrane protein